jgi:hypothetical protein
MENDVIFQPLRFRNFTVKNRIFRSNISGRFDNERTRNEFRVKVARENGFRVQGTLHLW